MSTYAWLAHQEGVLFTKWGPCECGGKNKCPACRWANWLERLHLDYCEEYDRKPKERE